MNIGSQVGIIETPVTLSIVVGKFNWRPVPIRYHNKVFFLMKA